eukprot:TRINITY_DN105358_c0_g1_i1.p1 TRINITY_DN105358_c0_g1~~TRINITY_DN105358_c0_g1_i1.p1  ORF type:complete len:572 (-),score=29.68 TRINITY_DN105358_c0_g1_i1:2048-3706(-)
MINKQTVYQSQAMGSTIEAAKEEHKHSNSIPPKPTPKDTITKKLSVVQSKLYSNHMAVLSDPNSLDTEYDVYNKLASTAAVKDKKGAKQRESLPKKVSGARPHTSHDKVQRRRLNIKLQDLLEANVEYNKEPPVVVQSTALDLIKEARMHLQANRNKDKIFETVVDSRLQYRASIAIRHPNFSKKLAVFDKVSLLPPEIFMKILSFLMDRFRVYLCVNPSWYSACVTAFDQEFNSVENCFVKMYSDYLLFKDSYTSSSYITCADNSGIRVDRVLKCENLPTTLGRTFVISFTYCYAGKPKEKYKATYKFDSVTRKNKVLWIYKNECFFHGAQEDDRASTQGIVPIAVGDNLEFAINYYSLRGLIDISTIEWLPPKLEKTPPENILTYKPKVKREMEKDRTRKVFADLSRICELEDSEMEWRDFRCERQPESVFPFEELRRCFKIEHIEYSNVDNYVIKMYLRACRKGYTEFGIFGIGVRVVDTEEECTNEVKKIGLWIERHADIELRIEDLLVFYYARSIEEESEEEQDNTQSEMLVVVIQQSCSFMKGGNI